MYFKSASSVNENDSKINSNSVLKLLWTINLLLYVYVHLKIRSIINDICNNLNVSLKKIIKRMSAWILASEIRDVRARVYTHALCIPLTRYKINFSFAIADHSACDICTQTQICAYSSLHQVSLSRVSLYIFAHSPLIIILGQTEQCTSPRHAAKLVNRSAAFIRFYGGRYTVFTSSLADWW